MIKAILLFLAFVIATVTAGPASSGGLKLLPTKLGSNNVQAQINAVLESTKGQVDFV